MNNNLLQILATKTTEAEKKMLELSPHSCDIELATAVHNYVQINIAYFQEMERVLLSIVEENQGLRNQIKELN